MLLGWRIPLKTRKQGAARVNVERLATIKMLTTVYAETKMYLPFSSHPKLMELFRELNIHTPLRFNHHLDRAAATRFATFISQQFHKTFEAHYTNWSTVISYTR